MTATKQRLSSFLNSLSMKKVKNRIKLNRYTPKMDPNIYGNLFEDDVKGNREVFKEHFELQMKKFNYFYGPYEQITEEQNKLKAERLFPIAYKKA